MDFATILQAIGSVGFPIVACCAMAYFFHKINDNYRNDVKDMTKAIENNTLVIQALVIKMGGTTNDSNVLERIQQKD